MTLTTIPRPSCLPLHPHRRVVTPPRRQPQNELALDSAALELTGWSTILHDNSNWIADSAYTTHGAHTPIKKSPGQERTDADKQYNKEIASIRSHVEHAIGHLKQWKIIATGYRGRLTELPEIISTITRLELYRLGW